jgi:cytochrome c5
MIAACMNVSFAADIQKVKGVDVYEYACKSCHAPDKAKASGAPAAFNAKAWQARITQAKAKVSASDKYTSVSDYFLHQVEIGKGLMHFGGLCQESKAKNAQLKCDDENILAAINYMTSAKK